MWKICKFLLFTIIFSACSREEIQGLHSSFSFCKVITPHEKVNVYVSSMDVDFDMWYGYNNMINDASYALMISSDKQNHDSMLSVLKSYYFYLIDDIDVNLNGTDNKLVNLVLYSNVHLKESEGLQKDNIEDFLLYFKSDSKLFTRVYKRLSNRLTLIEELNGQSKYITTNDYHMYNNNVVSKLITLLSDSEGEEILYNQNFSESRKMINFIYEDMDS